MFVSKSIKSRSQNKSSNAKSGSSTNSKAAKKSLRKNGQPDIATQYVLPLGNGWVVKNSKLKRFTFITDSKREAVFFARSIAKRRGERLEVYGKHGKVEEKRKYAKGLIN